MFASVSGEWNAESKLKIKGLEQGVSEEVLFYHSEVVDRACSNCKLHPKNQRVLMLINLICFIKILAG